MELPRGMALLNENTIIETNPFGAPGQFSYGHDCDPCPLRTPKKYRNMFHPKICFICAQQLGNTQKIVPELVEGKFRSMDPVLHGRPVVQAWSFSTPQSARKKRSTTGTRWWILVTNDVTHWETLWTSKKMLHKQWKTHLQIVDCRLHLGNLGNMFFLWINCW